MLLGRKHFFTNQGQYFLIGLISLLIVTGCQDDPVDFGDNILPGKSFLESKSYSDHILTSYNVTKDSVRTDDPYYGILGYLRDNSFGISDADLLTQVSPGQLLRDSAFNMGPDYFVDSLVLSLNYRFNWWYGNMFAEHNIKVFELLSDLYPSPHKYYSNLDVDGYYDPDNPLAERMSFINDDVPDSLWKRKGDNIWEYPDSLWNSPSYLWETSQGNTFESHYFRFKLTQELAQRFFTLDSATLADPSQFKQFFKGFYISSDLVDEADEGSLVRLDMLGSGTNLMLYYSHLVRNEDGEVTDTLQKKHLFPINVESVRVNRFMHDFEDKIQFNDSTTQHLYVQGMAGSYAKLEFPDEIYNWGDSISFVNDYGDSLHCRFSVIDLMFKVDTLASDIERYPPPNSLTIYAPRKDEDGNYLDENDNIVDKAHQVLYRPYYLDKYGKLQYAFSSGVFDPVLKLYYFNIKVDFLEFVIKRNEEIGVKLLKEIYLAPEHPEGNFQRVILNSSVAPSDSIFFNIGYVKYY